MSVVAAELAQLLTFEQGGEEYALPLRRVREIVEYERPTRLPATPPYVLGVIDVRGLVVPVVDLSAKLGQGVSSIGTRSCIVLVETSLGPSQPLVGVLVEAVRGVVELAVDERAAIEAQSDAGEGTSWYELQREGGSIWLLDIDEALAEEDVSQRPALGAGVGEEAVGAEDASPEGR